MARKTKVIIPNTTELAGREEPKLHEDQRAAGGSRAAVPCAFDFNALKRLLESPSFVSLQDAVFEAEAAKKIALFKARNDTALALSLSNENLADTLHQSSYILQVCAASFILQLAEVYRKVKAKGVRRK